MAKVKIQGHASGTGVITVTAPNTSTDRTITLPDATCTLADNSDVTTKLPLAGGILTGDLDISDTGVGALTVGGTTNTYSAPVLFNVTDLGLDITDGTKHLASWASHGGSSHAGSAIGTRSNHDLALITNDTKAVFIDTSGRVTMPSQPLATSSWSSTVAAGGVIPASSIQVNIGSHLASNGRFTAPVAGNYWYSVSAMKDTSTSNFLIRLYKNGSTVGEDLAAYTNSPVYSRATGFGYITLAANDYLEFYVAASHGSVHAQYGSISFALVS